MEFAGVGGLKGLIRSSVLLCRRRPTKNVRLNFFWGSILQASPYKSTLNPELCSRGSWEPWHGSCQAFWPPLKVPIISLIVL